MQCCKRYSDKPGMTIIVGPVAEVQGWGVSLVARHLGVEAA